MINLLTNLTSSMKVCLKIVNFLEIFLLKFSWKLSPMSNCFEFNVKKDDLTSWTHAQITKDFFDSHKTIIITITFTFTFHNHISQSHFTFHMQISIVMISSRNFQDANQWKSNGECLYALLFWIVKKKLSLIKVINMIH